MFLILVYNKIIYNKSLFGRISQTFNTFKKKQNIDGYINQINKKPVDIQKVIFKEVIIFSLVLMMIFLLASKVIFITAVISGSMYPTFNTDDLVLMQNIDHTYETGDIIMFERPDTLYPVVHRIKEITEKGIRTAGDATGQIDWWELDKKDIRGKSLLIFGKPVVIKDYGKFFILDDRNQEFGPFGKDYSKYFLFFQVIKIYGYVIVVFSLFLYVFLTLKQKPRQSR
jgi:signal peptidase